METNFTKHNTGRSAIFEKQNSILAPAVVNNSRLLSVVVWAEKGE